MFYLYLALSQEKKNTFQTSLYPYYLLEVIHVGEYYLLEVISTHKYILGIQN